MRTANSHFSPHFNTQKCVLLCACVPISSKMCNLLKGSQTTTGLRNTTTCSGVLGECVMSSFSLVSRESPDRTSDCYHLADVL